MGAKKTNEFAKNLKDLENTTSKLQMLAALGGDLLVEAVFTADEQDDVQFFEWAFSRWFGLVIALLENYDLPDRCTRCGVRLPKHAEGCGRS